MASLVEGNVCIENIKRLEVVEKNLNHIWKIADNFEGDV